MEKLTLNNTPIRTSNNFGINSIDIEIKKPEIIDFNNMMIMSYEMDNIEISNLSMMPSGKDMTSRIGLNLRCNYTITLTVPENVILDSPVILNFDFDEDNKALVDNIKIVMEKNSKADFILKYQSYEDNNFHYLKQETICKEGSEASITIANLIDSMSDSFIAIEAMIDKNAKADYILVDFGGKTKISNYYAKLLGDYSTNSLKTVYLGTNEDVIDINYNIEVYGKGAKCSIDTEGAIDKKAQKHFKGTIDFKEGCTKAKGRENENCMILSDNAKSKSLPILLCHEEDVEGEHGVSSGKIDEAKLFYIMTKGISLEEAKKLIIKANFGKIVRDIKDENLKNKIMELI